jgi:ABC-type Fe3+ transport system substrate-binding protein
VPKDWKDFLDPKWKGEFSIDDTRYEWFYALQKIYGVQDANKLIAGFIQNGVHQRRGGTLRAQLLSEPERNPAAWAST